MKKNIILKVLFVTTSLVLSFSVLSEPGSNGPGAAGMHKCSFHYEAPWGLVPEGTLEACKGSPNWGSAYNQHIKDTEEVVNGQLKSHNPEHCVVTEPFS
ncbi:hypothetical protein [Marinicella litoralis]|nr:hypothetical protein [Marinicella litoralis]